MRKKKIRGHRRRWKDIERWRSSNLGLNLIDYLKNVSNRDYVKIGVHPWSGITITNSVIPEPKGKTKYKILQALLDIFENWKKQLDCLGEPYYLKIWLYEPRFSKSQVVCAIGEDIDFYENTFHKPGIDKKIQINNYGNLKPKISELEWEYCLDEDHYDNSDPWPYASEEDCENEKKWFAKLLKKPHRTYKFSEPIGSATESYSFMRGNIWLGGKKM